MNTVMSDFDGCRTYTVIDLDTISRNVARIRALVPKTTGIIAVVKDDAYNHSLLKVSEYIERQVAMFAVSTIEEGMELRLSGIKKPILILGPICEEYYINAIKFGITLTLTSLREAYALSNIVTDNAYDLNFKDDKLIGFPDNNAHVHIAIDTGMSRIGLKPDEGGLRELKDILDAPGIKVDGAFTHFATADEIDKDETLKALSKFKSFRSLCEEANIHIPVWHAANTAAILSGIAVDLDYVRAGIGIYGIYPSDAFDRDKTGFEPALSWHAALSLVKTISKGTAVSYGYKFRADRDMKIGTVTVGYGDGYSRILSGKGTEVIVDGIRCPVLGNICMDQMMIDLSNVPDASRGDDVTLIGRDSTEVITAEELAAKMGTIAYEVLCNINKRVVRFHSPGNKAEE